MNKQDIINTNATEIAHAIRNITEDFNKMYEHPFVVGWEEKSSDLTSLIDNICDIYNHPRKNQELIYFLNQLKDSYYF